MPASKEAAPPISYNVKGAAQAIGVSFSTVRRWIDSGELPSFKLRGNRLVYREALETFMQQQQQPATAH